MGRNRQIKVTVVGDETSLARAFGRAGRQAGVLKGKLGKLAGVAGIAGLAVGIKKAGEAVVGMAGQFEESLAKIIGLVGVNKEQVEEWGDAILELAPKVGKSANELADALFFITSAGVRDSAEAMEVLESAAKAAAAGLGETKDVAFAAVSAMNAYGSENLSAAQATDILTKTVREGNLEASELASAIGQIIPIASEFGVEFDEVGASVAAMTRLGASAGESITNLQGIFKALIKPTAQANTAFGEMGTSAKELRTVMAEDGLLAALQMLREMLGKNEDAFTKVFGRVQGLTGFLSLMGKNAETTAGIFDSLSDSTGAADEAFGAMAETSNFQFRQALAGLQSAGIELGKEILPSLVDFVKDITPKLIELIPQFAELAVAIIDVAAAITDLIGPLIGPLGTALTSTGLLVAETSRQLHELSATFGLGSSSMTTFNRILHEMERQSLSTGDSLEDAKRVIRIMASEGIITTDVIAALGVEFGLTEVELAKIVRESRAWSPDVEGLNKVLEEAGISTSEWADDIDALRESEIRAIVETRDYGIAVEEVTEAEEDAEEATEDLEDVIKDLEERLIGARDAQESLSDVMRATADPVFNAVKKYEDLQEAVERYDDLAGEAKTTTADLNSAQLDVAAAMLDAQGAMDALDPTTLDESLTAISTALGISKTAVMGLLEELGLLDGKKVTTIVEVKAPSIIWERTPGGGLIPRKGRTTTISTGLAGLAKGGIATGPTQALVGEGGPPEAIIPLNEEGVAFLARALRAAGGVGGSSVNLNVESTADPAAIAFELGWALRTGAG